MTGWTVTPRQAAAMDAYAETGSYKGAARLLGVEERTIENHVQAVKKRTGARNTTLALLMWDRHVRSGAARPVETKDLSRVDAKVPGATVLALARRSRGVTAQGLRLATGTTLSDAAVRLNYFVRTGRLVKDGEVYREVRA